MSYNYDILSVIRKYSLPIHDRLNGIGISRNLKQGNLDKKYYLDWLIVTYQFTRGYETIMQAGPIERKVIEFAPDDLCITALENDIHQIDPSLDITERIELPKIKSQYHSIIPVYTLLGSLMGTQVIYNHVRKLQPDLPTTYLEAMLLHKSKWPMFKSYLSALSIDLPEDELGAYTKIFWNSIYRAYQKVYK
jgi:heme oxygenase